MVLVVVELLMQVVLEAIGSEDLNVALDILAEYQPILVEFLEGDMAMIYCLLVLWGAQIISSFWP